MKLATAINNNTYRAIVPTLKLADIESATLLDVLLSNGVGTRAEAMPYAVYYVSQLPTTKREPYKGQRGWTFGRGASEDKRVGRILDNIFKDFEELLKNNVGFLMGHTFEGPCATSAPYWH